MEDLFKSDGSVIQVRLTPVTCVKCGVLFGLPEQYLASLKSEAIAFYCPGGHRQWFGPSADQERIRELEKKLKEERSNEYLR